MPLGQVFKTFLFLASWPAYSVQVGAVFVLCLSKDGSLFLFFRRTGNPQCSESLEYVLPASRRPGSCALFWLAVEMALMEDGL